MIASWREIVQVFAIYYKAGEYPFGADTHPDEAYRPEWYDDGEVWWWPGLSDAASRSTNAEDLRPSVDEGGRLTTDAIRMEFTVCAAGVDDRPYGSSLIAYQINNNGLHETFVHDADALKACLDAVRADVAERYVSALVVYECQAGREPDTCNGPGEYIADWQPVGLLDLAVAPVTPVN